MPHLIVGIGEVLWDVFGEEKHLGGATANFAFHANALGDRGVIVSRVGRDPLGDELVERLAALGLTTDHVQLDPDRPTGTVQVRVDADGQPTFTITRDVAWDRLQTTDSLLQLAAEADAVCYGTLAQRDPVSRRTIRAFVDAATGALRVCDLNLRADLLDFSPADPDQLDRVVTPLRAAHVLKLNDDELRILHHVFLFDGDADSFVAWLLDEFELRLVCVTRGAAGCRLRSATETADAPGERVTVADTVGAGDAFTAAMVHHLLRGRPLAETAAFANRVGAFVASQPGATPALPAGLIAGAR
jgi:fructokinase